MQPVVYPFFDSETGTFTYIVKEPGGSHCAVIDSVLGFDLKSGRTNHVSADVLVAFIRDHGLVVDWILETHAHADHLSAAAYLQSLVGGKIAVGQAIRAVQRTFAAVFGLGSDFAQDGSQFDHLFADGERFQIGGLSAQALSVPGHTPADMAYLVGDAAFIGDTLFMPDVGTARCDFPGGSAKDLFWSIQKLLALPEPTRLFTGHDYAPGARGAAGLSTIAEQRAYNVHKDAFDDEAAFVALRTARDATLAVPNLILPSLQVNIRAGHLPPASEDGRAYLKIPVDVL